MVVHGYDTTLPITLDEMLVHCRAVAHGDFPFGCYESSTNQAVDSAVRVLKEGGMNAIKLEGGSPSRITAAKSIVEAGIVVMGHVGLTPQAISVLGVFRPQGRNVASTVKVVETALALQEGCSFIGSSCVGFEFCIASAFVLEGFTYLLRLRGFCFMDDYIGFFELVDIGVHNYTVGCFSVVLECVPPPVAAAATSALQIPTIGIGAGPCCNGLVS
ncbi:hypothetical protein ACE6H2_016016 [Prunus campanulata]